MCDDSEPGDDDAAYCRRLPCQNRKERQRRHRWRITCPASTPHAVTRMMAQHQQSN
jgi:hypothetical protein